MFFVFGFFTTNAEAAPAKCREWMGTVPVTTTCPTGAPYLADTCWERSVSGSQSENTYKSADCTTFSQVRTLEENIKEKEKIDVAQRAQNDVNSASNNLPSCEIISSTPKIIGCFAQAIYYIFYIPTAFIAGIFGSLFDFFLGYSVSDETYRYDFAVTGWRLVRDIANIIFIVIIVWTGIAAVFDFGGKAGTTMRRVIPRLIINALIINFSLFATRTVIDLSNITARIFYSRMIVCTGECRYEGGSSTPVNIKRGAGGYWPVSEKIVSGFDPQKMFSPSILVPPTSDNTDASNPFGTGGSANVVSGAQESPGKFATDSAEYAAYYALVSVLSAGIMIAIAIMFWKTGFFFVGRVVGLYVAMIFSPLAFLTLNGGGGFFKVKGFEWDSWLDDLSKYAMLAPVFIFFLYIIYAFFESNIVTQIGLKNPSGFFETLIEIVVPMALIFVLIDTAQKKATEYAGKFGHMIQGFAQKTIGTVGTIAGGGIGLAAGGAALAGTRFGAKAVGALSNIKGTGGGSVAGWAARNASTNSFAKWTNTALNKAQTGTWDVRNTQVGQGILGTLNKGMNFVGEQIGEKNQGLKDTISNRVGLGQKAREGGRIAQVKQKEKAREAQLTKGLKAENFSHLSEDQIKAIWGEKIGEKIQLNTRIEREEKIKELIREDLSTNDKEYKDNQDTIAAQSALEKVIQTLEKTLEQNTNKDSASYKAMEQELAKTRGTQMENTQKVEKAQKAIFEKEIQANRSEEKVSSITGGATYKNFESNLLAKAKQDIEKEYSIFGEIKNAESMANVMQYDHVKGIRENSAWMKNDRQREFAPIGGLVGGAAAGLAGFTGAAAGAVVYDIVQEAAQITDNVTKSILEDFKKKGERKVKATKHAKNTEEKIKTAVEFYEKEVERSKEKIRSVLRDGVAAGESIETLTQERTKQIVENQITDKQSEFDIAQINFNKAAKDFTEGKNGITETMVKNLSKERKQKQDELESVKNLLAKSKKMEEELLREQEKLEKIESQKNAPKEPLKNAA